LLPCSTKWQTLLTLSQQVRSILQRLEAEGVIDLKDTHVEYALRSRSTDGDVEKAYELLQVFEDALQGTIRAYNKDTKLLGAENRELVTCWLDSLLFAMFARLDSFESMLSVDFHDAARKRLVTILRLWVNMLRSGKFITPDITKNLQESLSACGWEEAAKLRQQDVSEAFCFITGKLDLPLLTLKMDVYHTGKEDADDHKIVKERLLDVAIPPQPEDGSEIKLEDCLEAYFNNRIEVKRHLQRRNTLQSMRPSDQKGAVTHLETIEVGSPGTTTAQSERLPPFSPPLNSHGRPSLRSHGRADSIFNKKIIEIGEPSEIRAKDDISIHKRVRAPTIKREVLMPAWQFFSLIRRSTRIQTKLGS
jgi:Ubiquitin carboxyl-terminal hydrolase